MYEVRMPMFGATMTSGEINEWFVAPGDEVKTGDKLCEISSNKITNSLEAFCDGTLKEIIVEEGDEAPVGELIALIDDGK